MPNEEINLMVSALKEGKDRCAHFEPKTSFGEHLHETHLSHIIGLYLESKNYWTVLEAGCEEYENDRCDLYALKDGIELWCEIKRGWHGIGSGWVTKPQEELKTWIDDIVKLTRIKNSKPVNCYFLLLHFRQKKFDYFVESIESQVASKIVNSLRENKDYHQHIPLRISMQSAVNIIGNILQISSKENDKIEFDLTNENDSLIYRLYCGKIDI